MDKFYSTLDINEKMFTTILSSMPGGVFVYRADESEEILYANTSTLKLFECTTLEEFKEVTGGSFSSLVYVDDRERVYEEIHSQIQENNGMFDHVTYRITTAKGKVLMIEDYGRKAVIEGLGEVYIVFILNSEAMAENYTFDRLTELQGKEQFLRIANETLDKLHNESSDKRMLFLYFNINNFKLLNIKYGVTEGDKVLKSAADILKAHFGRKWVSRISDDHFVVMTERSNLDRSMVELYRELQAKHKKLKITGSLGIYEVTDTSIDAEIACDYAKMACDSIKDLASTSYAFFNEQIEKKMESRYYVINHIDEAVEKGYIQIYYQPVIRALTGNLTGFEALARWIDPLEGFMSPSDFIPALEEAQLIHKLDIYMIKEICRQYRECIDKGIPYVPVSFNLSRLDFMLTDIRKEIIDVVNYYQVPHDMINIEITESMFVDDDVSIKNEIEEFHKLGFNVWMDDFGSGYSSLNVLKDYDFDELKIDMAFLSNFNEKSKNILKSTVRMAKQIGIQTLAEGVETKEHYEFLRDIGCEKIQGYYFGKPAPYLESLEHCFSKGMRVESRSWASYFDKVGEIDFLTDNAFALLEDDGHNLRFHFMNDVYLKELRRNGTNSVKEAEYNINSPGPMRLMFRKFTEELLTNKVHLEKTYPSGSDYMRVRADLIAQNEEYSMMRVDLANITRNARSTITDSKDEVMRNILYMYDGIASYDVATDRFEYLSLLAGDSALVRDRTQNSITEVVSNYSKNMLFVDDREDFKSFVDVSTFEKRLKESGNAYLSEYFRFKEASGGFEWYVVTLLVVPKTEGKKILILINKAALNTESTRIKLANNYIKEFIADRNKEDEFYSEHMLWHNIKDYSSIKYFWKDQNRRFLGASQSFLDYYDLCLEDIVGKTDEDMAWHVAIDPYRHDEMEVIESGKRTFNVPGTCIIKGQLHNISASKMPIFKDGKIVGLFGYFIDLDTEATNRNREDMSLIDPITGTENTKGIMQHFIEYGNSYKRTHNDFVGIHIKLEGYDSFRENYGDEFGNLLLQEAARYISEEFSHVATVGHLMAARFIVLCQSPDCDEINRKIEKIRNRIMYLTHIKDKKCTCFMKSSYVLASETETFEEMMFKILNPMLKAANLHTDIGNDSDIED